MEAQKYENIIYEKREAVAWITLNRPKVLNALNIALIGELRSALEEARGDPEVRAIVITGAGEKAFCAGADIPEILNLTPFEARRFSLGIHSLTRFMEQEVQKPIIARIRGFCLGGGLELAMACDFRIASEDARFGQPEINLGLIPGGGGTQRLPRIIGKAKALELEMTGDMIDAAEAYRLNLVNKVVPPEELDKAVEELLGKLLSKSSATLAILKLAINKGMEMNLDSALFYEAECFACTRSLEDATEGLKAFSEKRKPEFKGR